MSGIVFEIAIVLLLILLNGVFAMSEIAILSARRVRLEQKAKSGSKGAETALELATHPDNFLSTVQIGITLVGIFAGAFGGATLAQELADILIPVVGERFATSASLAVVVGSITYLSVVMGELAPKQIALRNAETISALVSRPMKGLSWIATPVVRLLSGSTNALIRVLGIPKDSRAAVTEEEIKVMVEQGAQVGIIEEAERDMVEGVFRLGDYRLSAVMTPRPEIVWLDLKASPEKIQDTLENSESSRFPVCDGDLDNVVGIVRAKNLLTAVLQNHSLDLKDHILKPVFMPENMLAIRALDTFKKSGTHLALIVDEYGSVEGLVTLYDILEAIVGDIPTLEEIEEPRIIKRQNGSWLVDGLIGIQDFKNYFKFDSLPDEDSFQTLGGFIITALGHIPQAGEYFDWNNYRFEVADMDGKRVDKVLMQANPSPTAESEKEPAANK